MCAYRRHRNCAGAPELVMSARAPTGAVPMSSLIAASAFFLLIHFGVSGTRLRDVLVARMGAGPYQGVFALGSIIGILWMIHAYGRAPTVELWGQLLGLRPLA